MAKLSQVILIDEGEIQAHLGGSGPQHGEEKLNTMLDAEADRLCRAERYERTEARKDEGCASRILRATPADESWRSHAEGAKAAHFTV